MEQNNPPAQKNTNDLAEDRTNLAYERTVLANDRTLMAWIRTSTSLISFGFTIYKFFQEFRKSEDIVNYNTIFSSRDIGLVLIGFGFTGLFFALIQYRSDMNRIKMFYSKAGFNFTPLLALLMLIFSLLLFLVTFLRL
ncbi:MAG: DUF202 domain-containing protein [Bacteroidetes bacterium]|nr:DUF202 domain-containing protein [Bacteroidota bacterium]